MSICTDIVRSAVLTPRRIRRAECSAFEGLNRWVNFCCCLNLTVSPADNDVASGVPAWSLWDLPVSVAFQDVDDRGNDLNFVAVGDRIYVLDWDRYRDEWQWDTFYPIYRRYAVGPIPGSRDEQEGGRYELAHLKRFRRFTFELAVEPIDGSQYRVSVNEDGADDADAASGYRTTQRHGNAQVARRGYSFIVTLEHEANEDFPLLWWQADWEALGDRRANDPVLAP